MSQPTTWQTHHKQFIDKLAKIARDRVDPDD
jgi:hypothetical protein